MYYRFTSLVNSKNEYMKLYLTKHILPKSIKQCKHCSLVSTCFVCYLSQPSRTEEYEVHSVLLNSSCNFQFTNLNRKFKCSAFMFNAKNLHPFFTILCIWIRYIKENSSGKNCVFHNGIGEEKK